MNALYKISAIVIALFVICGCENNHTDQIDSVSYQIVYENNSNHIIDIVCDSKYYQYPREMEILQGKGECLFVLFSIQGKDSKQRDAKAQKLVVPEMVTVVYDNEYSITFSRGTEMDNLCYINDYQCKVLGEQQRLCQYTFTEEDYEYAKTNGVKLENSVEQLVVDQ